MLGSSASYSIRPFDSARSKVLVLVFKKSSNTRFWLVATGTSLCLHNMDSSLTCLSTHHQNAVARLKYIPCTAPILVVRMQQLVDDNLYLSTMTVLDLHLRPSIYQVSPSVVQLQYCRGITQTKYLHDPIVTLCNITQQAHRQHQSRVQSETRGNPCTRLVFAGLQGAL